jgi:hypothetical protein
LDLAREIQADVASVGASGGDAQALVEAVQAVPRRERLAMAREVFARLPADRQWEVLAQAFDDGELREALEKDRQDQLTGLRRQASVRRLIRPGSARQIDMGVIDPDLTIGVGLFSERDVAAALERGMVSSSCARYIELYSEPSGLLRVLADVFNPAGGYFVTRAYDEDTWRAERLEAHSLVRIGSIGGTEHRFEPVVYGGGRADFEIEGEPAVGRLYVGFVVIQGIDLLLERGT